MSSAFLAGRVNASYSRITRGLLVRWRIGPRSGPSPGCTKNGVVTTDDYAESQAEVYADQLSGVGFVKVPSALHL